MKNQYAGDIGDFGKYLLLNFLCYEYNSLVKLDYKLGVNWYLTENDDTNHGNDIEYLKEDKENLKSCLPPYSNHVYEKMLNIINNERTISSIEKLNVLPTNAIFYNDIITVQERKSWLNNSVKHLGKSNLIFCDPDNSIIASNNKNNINSMLAEELKLYYSEIEANFIIYFQHRWREGSISNNINQIIVPILKEMDPHIRFRVLIYNKGKSKRLYVIINKLKDIKLYLKLDLLLNIIDENIFYELPMTPMNHNTNRTIETDNEIIIEDFPAGNNSELILARKIARMENFKNVVPAIDNPRELKIDLKFSPIEYMRICYGFIPQAMEDRWIIYAKDNNLYFHRSWTGNCIYILEITKSNEEYIVNKAWASKEEGPQENNEDIENIKNIIKYNLLAEY